MKKKVYIGALVTIFLAYVIYSLFNIPKVLEINTEYQTEAYKLNDSQFARKISVKLTGHYFLKTDQFKGTISINNKDYMSCLLSSGVGMICYDGGRTIYGQTYIGKDFKEITLEIESGQLYSNVSNNEPYTESLIISLPATDRNTSISLNNKLKDDYYNNLIKK
ncbi:MAG: hypothetical protein JWM44_1048 [Bacilli bacterium]|nr:hypothetical protein [Bacilli bacterium]